MAWLTGTVVILVIFSALSAQETGSLALIYPSRTISAARGSSVKLTCDVEYHFTSCGLLQVVWTRSDHLLAKLTDPDKYITAVNETILEDGITRRRQVVTEIVHLTERDAGAFQCIAECEDAKTAVGHIVDVQVQG